MSRSFLACSIALTTAAIFGTGASASLAQPSIGTSSSSPPPSATDTNAAVQDAIKYLSSTRDLNGALAKLKAVAHAHGELPSQYVMMYRILAQSNQPNLARAMPERSITDPETADDPEPWVILGSIALQDNRMAEGELDFLKARQLLPGFPNKERKAAVEHDEMLGMAEVAERRGRWEDAEARLEEYLAKYPDDIVALQRLARAMFTLNKAGQSSSDKRIGAYDILKKAKAIDKANALKQKTREQMLPAEAYMAQYYDANQHAHEAPGKREVCTTAKTWFGYALERAKNDMNLRAVVTVWALENGDAELAKQQADAALEIEKHDAELPAGQRQYAGSIAGKMLSGYVALWQKRFPDAEKFFQDVIFEQPNDFGAKNNLALALVEQDDSTKQHRALDYALGNYQANKDGKEGADALSTLAWVYFRLNSDQASFVMDQVLKATNGNVSNPDTATYLAYILDRNKQKYNAKQVLSNILQNGRSFSMRPEAEKLYAQVKDEQPPAAATSKAP